MKVTEEEENQHQTPEKLQESCACCERMATHMRGGVKPREGLEFSNLDECEYFYSRRRPMKESINISTLFVLSKVFAEFNQCEL